MGKNHSYIIRERERERERERGRERGKERERERETERETERDRERDCDKLNFQQLKVSWKLFSGCFINAVMTAHE